MTISPDDKDDVVSSVMIEMERMFTVLSIRFPPDHPDQALLLKKVETDFKAALETVD